MGELPLLMLCAVKTCHSSRNLSMGSSSCVITPHHQGNLKILNYQVSKRAVFKNLYRNIILLVCTGSIIGINMLQSRNSHNQHESTHNIYGYI